jgi:hypothetical protein
MLKFFGLLDWPSSVLERNVLAGPPRRADHLVHGKFRGMEAH